MLYTICKAKNKISASEEFPKFNSDNWEVLENVKCRSNATLKTFNEIFTPIYQKLSKEFQKENNLIRLWNFRADEITK